MKSIIKALFLLVALTAVPVFAQTEFESTKARAEAGDAQAQYELGYMLHLKSETVRNYQEAAKWPNDSDKLHLCLRFTPRLYKCSELEGIM